MKTKNLVVLEFNEVNGEVLHAMVAQGRLPNFAKLQGTSMVVPTTVKEDYEHLEPWIQWVTVHTGKTQAEHGAFNLSDVQHTRLRQIWDVLAERGIRCGVVSPMNARRGSLNQGFFIPDPWSVSEDSFPKDLEPIYKFLAEKVQAHNISLEAGSSKFGFAWALFKAGVPLTAIGRLALAYLQSRLESRNKWKLVAELDLFLWGVTKAMHLQQGTRYNSVFLNGVAHYQHHYWSVHDAQRWAPRFPRLFAKRNPVAEQNLRQGDDPIAFGLTIYDRIVGDALKTFGPEGVIVLTGLSQLPFDGYGNDAGFYLYRLVDHARSLDALGVRYERLAPLMSRDAMVYFADDAQRTAALAILRTACIGDQEVFLCTEESDSRLFFKVTYSYEVRPDTTVQAGNGRELDFAEHFKLITFKTGHHSNEGLLIAPRACLAPRAEAMPLEEVATVLLRAMELQDAAELGEELRLSPTH